MVCIRDMHRGLARGSHRPLIGRFATAAGGGGGGAITLPTWAESQAAGDGWTSFTADGSGGFTATSDGASVAITPSDLTSELSGSVQYSFSVDTLSAGTLEFALDSSGAVTDASLDTGAITRVTGGTKSGNKVLFTSTGSKVVVISGNENNTNLKPKFRYNEAAGNVVISGFAAVAVASVDLASGLKWLFDTAESPTYYRDNNWVDERYSFNHGSGTAPRPVADCPSGVGTYSWDHLDNVSPWLCKDSASPPWRSNFETGVDGCTSVGASGVLTLSVADGIGGKDNVLKCIGDDAVIDRNYAVRSATFSSVTYCDMYVDVYIPSTNTVVDGLTIKYSSGGRNYTIPTDQWTRIYWTVSNATYIQLDITQAGSTGLQMPSTDIVYLKNFTVHTKASTYPDYDTTELGITSGWENWSMGVWVKRDTSANLEYFWGNNQLTTNPATGTMQILFPADDSVTFRWWDSTTTLHDINSGAATISQDTWYHLYVSYEAGNLISFYLNGSLVGTFDMSAYTIRTVTSKRILIGGTGNNYFNGKTAQNLYWNYAGNAEHASALYASGTGISRASISASYTPVNSEVSTYVTNVEAAGGNVDGWAQSWLDEFMDELNLDTSLGALSRIKHIWIPVTRESEGSNVAIFENGGQNLTMPKVGSGYGRYQMQYGYKFNDGHCFNAGLGETGQSKRMGLGYQLLEIPTSAATDAHVGVNSSGNDFQVSNNSPTNLLYSYTKGNISWTGWTTGELPAYIHCFPWINFNINYAKASIYVNGISKVDSTHSNTPGSSGTFGPGYGGRLTSATTADVYNDARLGGAWFTDYFNDHAAPSTGDSDYLYNAINNLLTKIGRVV